jgi:hypothetical protein
METLGTELRIQSPKYSMSWLSVMISIIDGNCILPLRMRTLIMANRGHGPLEFWVIIGVLFEFQLIHFS